MDGSSVPIGTPLVTARRRGPFAEAVVRRIGPKPCPNLASPSPAFPLAGCCARCWAPGGQHRVSGWRAPSLNTDESAPKPAFPALPDDENALSGVGTGTSPANAPPARADRAFPQVPDRRLRADEAGRRDAELRFLRDEAVRRGLESRFLRDEAGRSPRPSLSPRSWAGSDAEWPSSPGKDAATGGVEPFPRRSRATAVPVGSSSGPAVVRSAPPLPAAGSFLPGSS